MKLDDQGNLIDGDQRRSCTWNRSYACGTHCLHFKLTKSVVYGDDGIPIQTAGKHVVLLCSPHKVEIQLESD